MSPQTHGAGPGSAPLLALVDLIVALKALPRTGWLDRGVAPLRAESVADHSFAVALLAWAAAVERQAAGAALDPARVVLLALVHDLAEAGAGDATPYDPAAMADLADDAARRAFLERRHVRDASREAAKRTAEAEAMAALFARLSPAIRATLEGLWQELREGSSAEARFVKQTDRLETYLQSRAYLRDDPDLPVASFQKEVDETIDDPLLAALRDAALQRP